MIRWSFPALACLLALIPEAASGGTPEDACVPDVVRAVKALEARGTPLRVLSTDAFPNGASLPPHHIQGFARIAGTQTVVFAGNTVAGAYLYIGNLASQPRVGRWSTNYNCKSSGCATPPSDRLEKIFFLGSKLPHPGGIQAIGSLLAVGVDQGADKPSEIRFLDLGSPQSPLEKRNLRIQRSMRRSETTGITRLRAGKSSGKYLVVVGSDDSSWLTFYLSRGTDLDDPKNGFTEAGTWVEGLSGANNPDYQALQLVSQCDGQVFLLGTTGWPVSGGMDLIDVHRVTFPLTGPRVEKVLRKRMSCATCLFRAGAGVLVEPSTQELRYYGTSYWPWRAEIGAPVLRFEEFTP